MQNKLYKSSYHWYTSTGTASQVVQISMVQLFAITFQCLFFLFLNAMSKSALPHLQVPSVSNPKTVSKSQLTQPDGQFCQCDQLQVYPIFTADGWLRLCHAVTRQLFFFQSPFSCCKLIFAVKVKLFDKLYSSFPLTYEYPI